MTDDRGPEGAGHSFAFDIVTNVVASFVAAYFVLVLTPLWSGLPFVTKVVVGGVSLVLLASVGFLKIRRIVWHPVARFIRWLLSFRLTSRRPIDLNKLARLMVGSPDVVITGFVPRDLMETLRETRGARRTPEIKLLTPKRSLIYDETPGTRAQLIAWQDGVLGLSNYIGGLGAKDGGIRRQAELGDFIVDMEHRFTGCLVQLGKRSRRTFTVAALPEHHPEFTDEVTVVSEVFGDAVNEAERWVRRLLSDAKPVKMREVLCRAVGNVLATGTEGAKGEEPPFGAMKLVTYGDVPAREGFLIPRVALIPRYAGPSVLLSRRSRLKENGDQDKLSILTQRIQDIDLLEVARRLNTPNQAFNGQTAKKADTTTRDVGAISLQSFRGMLRVERSQPFTLPMEVYRAAAVREALLSLGVADAESRLKFECFAVLPDPVEKSQKGFVIFTLDLTCDGDDDEVVRAMDLNRHRLVEADANMIATEIAANTANDLIAHRAELISKLSFGD